MKRMKRRDAKQRHAYEAMGTYASPAVEWACTVDRRWFEQHPGVTERTRLIISGEFPPGLADGCTHVVVRKVSPDVRIRIPLAADAPGGSACSDVSGVS